ncbi:serine/threonine-protein kinase 4-like isoform X3 [Hordeum vulgare subsp. vulgare]|uniref:serine/threonine-protein kinase 4-like isoform X3 n=1 Tax=Hordeum vulgare subsp. vulgare TaxID=112509 RepID=UPI001D1A5113|nr:serine/threonine-protein kinase 4-like isoform X3 [Hordeum vulgare subsp. vulgare]
MVRGGSMRRPSLAAAAEPAVPEFTVSPDDYRLMEEVGFGANAVVYRAIFLPANRTIAVKCLDLDRVNSNLDDVRKEAQIMSLIDHPNVIRAYCSFVVDHNLWVIMPFMAEGSCLHLMKVAHPDGLEEPVICSILKETLKALAYLHGQGHIHRDVKAGNILIDSPGVVKLGDFGVSACLFDRGDRQRSRNTFVGTPCWMAPEVLQPGTGYNFKADIWSFGITALELAHGHAPFSKYPPMKVLLMTLQNAPPGLDYDRDRKFSKSFKEMVAMCLVKDQTKRPTAEKLLKHSFFKNTKAPQLTVKSILTDLPPLWDRVKALQQKDAAHLASSEQEALSMSEYQRGVSAWHFDIEDLKAQALLINDDDPPELKEDDDSARVTEIDKGTSFESHFGQSALLNGNNHRLNHERTCTTAVNPGGNGPETSDEFASDLGNADSPRMVDGRITQGTENDSLSSTSKQGSEAGNPRSEVRQRQRTFSGPVMYSGTRSSSLIERGHIIDKDAGGRSLSNKQKSDTGRIDDLSGPLSLSTRASANSLSAPIRSSGGYVGSLGDKPRVEIKGRFSVTSENVDLAKVQEIPVIKISHKPQESNSHHRKEFRDSSVSASILIPHLENLVQQTTFQQDIITNLMSNLQQNEKPNGPQTRVQNMEGDTGVETGSAERERKLLAKVFELQSRMISLTDELIASKLKHVQLQEELNTLYIQEEIADTREDGNGEA